jgi:c-di-GMP-binding flagellar brake protein YcgR
MFSQVMRVIEKDGENFEYGCRFLEMTDDDQEKISQNIFAAQRLKRGRT